MRAAASHSAAWGGWGVIIRGRVAPWALLAMLACGAAHASVELVHEATDLVRHNYFRLSPQASIVDSNGTVHAFARNSGLVERRLEAGEWVEEAVDPYVGAGADLSASIGPDDVIHVLYQTTEPCVTCTTPGFFTQALRYARKVGGTWQITALSEELKELLRVSQIRAIAAGSGGTLDVLGLGLEGSTGGLYHTHFDGSAWSHEKLLDTGFPSATDLRTIGLSRAPDGTLHGALLDGSISGTYSLRYFSKAPAGAWQARLIREYTSADTIRSFIGITATDGSTADILVSSHDTLDHFRVTPDAADAFTIDDGGQPFLGGVTYPALVAAPGQPLTAAFNVIPGSNDGHDAYQLWLATFDGTAWSAEKVYGTGMFGSGTPVPTRADPPQVHYANGALHVLNKETGSFWELPGDVQAVSDWTRAPGAWERSTVIQSQVTASVTGKRIAAVADAQNRLHALHLVDDLDFFSPFDAGLVMYVAETSGSPISERIPLGGGYLGGEGLALAVAPGGTVHGIVEGSDYIRHIARTSGTWTVTDITTPFEHLDGSRMALTLDADDNLHACVYRNVFVDSQYHARLDYLTNATGTWTQEAIVADMGWTPVSADRLTCAIRILGDGSVNVAYANLAGDLHKATRGPGGWSDVELVAQSILEPRVQIAPLIDADGFVHASFTRYLAFGPTYIPNGIGYGSNTGVIWAEELVDDDAQLGIEWDYLYRAEIWDHSPLYRSRIAQAPNGNIHLFYYDEGLYFARGAVRVDGAWRNIPVDLTETSGPFGDVVAMPDNTARYVYAVERSGAVRATTSIPGPALFLEGDLGFPQTVVGDSVTASFTVVNHGAQALALSGIGIQSDSYNLLAQGTTCASGTVLQPGQTCTLAIEYEPAPYETQPTTSSERLGLLLIASNDPWSEVGYTLEGLTAYPEESESGGGGGPVPLDVSAGFFLFALLRRQRPSRA